MNPKLSSLSIFFPCFNDGLSLQNLIPEAIATAAQIADIYEIIVIENGSDAETHNILQMLKMKHPSLRVLVSTEKLGYGGALLKGFQACKMETVFYTDGDGQYDVKELPRLAKALGPDIDVVNGYKTNRADPGHRILIGRAYHFFTNFVFSLSLRDVDCDFRLFRKEVVDSLALQYSSGAVCVEMMKQIRLGGFRIAEVPVSHHPRLHGRSQFFRFPSVVRTLTDLSRLWLHSCWRGCCHHQQPHTYRKTKTK